ncbi:hypothetical protein MTO96_008511 [Rhipicephalus appendiculatus]
MKPASKGGITQMQQATRSALLAAEAAGPDRACQASSSAPVTVNHRKNIESSGEDLRYDWNMLAKKFVKPLGQSARPDREVSNSTLPGSLKHVHIA